MLECTVRVRGSYTRSKIGCVLGPAPWVVAVVVYGFEAEAMRAATRFGEVLLLKGRCRGEKYVWRLR